eukprot:180525-Chlamydomonas_euryale.AAC.11
MACRCGRTPPAQDSGARRPVRPTHARVGDRAMTSVLSSDQVSCCGAQRGTHSRVSSATASSWVGLRLRCYAHSTTLRRALHYEAARHATAPRPAPRASPPLSGGPRHGKRAGLPFPNPMPPRRGARRGGPAPPRTCRRRQLVTISNQHSGQRKVFDLTKDRVAAGTRGIPVRPRKPHVAPSHAICAAETAAVRRPKLTGQHGVWD